MMMDEETEEMIHRNSIESFKSKAMQIDSRQGNNKSSLIKKLPSNNAAVDTNAYEIKKLSEPVSISQNPISGDVSQ